MLHYYLYFTFIKNNNYLEDNFPQLNYQKNGIRSLVLYKQLLFLHFKAHPLKAAGNKYKIKGNINPMRELISESFIYAICVFSYTAQNTHTIYQ